MAPQRPHPFAHRPKNPRRRLKTFCAYAQHISDSPWFACPPTKGGSLRAQGASVGSHQSADDRLKKKVMKLSSVNGAPEEPVSHNPAAKKQVWFRRSPRSRASLSLRSESSPRTGTPTCTSRSSSSKAQPAGSPWWYSTTKGFEQLEWGHTLCVRTAQKNLCL